MRGVDGKTACHAAPGGTATAGDAAQPAPLLTLGVVKRKRAETVAENA
jgi:hypothetical protein